MQNRQTIIHTLQCAIIGYKKVPNTFKIPIHKVDSNKASQLVINQLSKIVDLILKLDCNIKSKVEFKFISHTISCPAV